MIPINNQDRMHNTTNINATSAATPRSLSIVLNLLLEYQAKYCSSKQASNPYSRA